MTYAHTDEMMAEVHAPPDRLFDHLDDQARIGAHMEKPSLMMMGGRMTYGFDEAKGRAVGSVIRVGGSFLGIRLFIEEVVTERDPPRRKVWETRGQPHILIIGAYRMGFEITPSGHHSNLRVFIEYDHAPSPIGRILGSAFAPLYARWCVKRMADDARLHFQ
jgi:hypothetical protein